MVAGKRRIKGRRNLTQGYFVEKQNTERPMSLDHVLSSFGLSRRDPNSLEARIESLQRDMRRIGRSVSKQASHTADDWSDNISDFGHQAAKQGMQLAEAASTQAWRGARAVRRDPLPAIAVVGTVLLLASFFRR